MNYNKINFLQNLINKTLLSSQKYKLYDILGPNEVNITINTLISEEYLVFPIFKKFNTIYLWEKDNFWYDNLIQEYDNQSLLKLYFPEKNHLNKFRILLIKPFLMARNNEIKLAIMKNISKI